MIFICDRTLPIRNFYNHEHAFHCANNNTQFIGHMEHNVHEDVVANSIVDVMRQNFDSLVRKYIGSNKIESQVTTEANNLHTSGKWQAIIKKMKEKTKWGNQTHWNKVENLEVHEEHKEIEWNSVGWRGEYPWDYVLNNKIRRTTCGNKVDNPLL